MGHYKSNVRDQVFNLFEVLGIDKAFGEGDYTDLDADTARGPVRDARVMIIHPDVTSLDAGRREVHGDDERFFNGDALRALRQAHVGYQPGDRNRRLGGRPNDQARGLG